MNRWAYTAVLTAIVVLAIYAFWPQVLPNETIIVHPSATPVQFKVVRRDLNQEVIGKNVNIEGHIRPLDVGKSDHLWDLINELRVPKNNTTYPGVGDLGAYSLNDAPTIEAKDWMIKWSQIDKQGYLFDGHALFRVDSRVTHLLDELTSRLDVQEIFPEVLNANHIELNSRTYLLGRDGWYDSNNLNRPSMTTRIQRVLNWIHLQKYENVKGPMANSSAVEKGIVIECGNPSVKHRVTVHAEDKKNAIDVDDLPPQTLDTNTYNIFHELCDDLDRDYLVDLDPGAAVVQVSRIEVDRGSAPLFSVDRRQQVYRPGETEWSISWAEGRERGSEQRIYVLLNELCSLMVNHVEKGPDPAPVDFSAIHFHVVFQNGAGFDMTINGDRLWTPWFHGESERSTQLQLKILGQLENIQPVSVMDARLISDSMDRLRKIQRRIFGKDFSDGTVFTRLDSGIWKRTYPTAIPVDSASIGRLARALCGAQSISARQCDREDAAARASAICEIALRFEPRSQKVTRRDVVDERDTIPTERVFSYYRDKVGASRLIDLNGGVSYEIASDLADVLMEPIQNDRLIPIVPTLVNRIEIINDQERFILMQHGEFWTVQDTKPGSEGEQIAVEDTEVRRLLRSLSALQSSDRASRSERVQPSNANIIISCLMSSGGDEERLSLYFQLQADGGARVSVDSSHSLADIPNGSFNLSPDLVRRVNVRYLSFVRLKTP